MSDLVSPVTEAVLSQAPTLLSYLPWATPLVQAMIGAGLTRWQSEQMAKQFTAVEYALKSLDQKKINRSELDAPSVKNLLEDVLQQGRRTDSDIKRRALAQAFASACIEVPSRAQCAAIYVRIVGSLTDAELSVLHACDRCSKDQDGTFRLTDVSGVVGADSETTLIAFEALAQQGLVYSPPTVATRVRVTGRSDLINRNEVRWALSVLALGMIAWCSFSDQSS